MPPRRPILGWSLICIVACALAPCAHADQGDQVFQLEDDPDAIHLTDRPIGAGARLIAGSPAAPAPSSALATTRNPVGIHAIVQQAAQASALDPALLHAVIAAESAYSPTAVSRRGAQGLMQLMPATARAYGVGDPFDPGQNVRAGAMHLRHLLDQFNQNLPLALAAYNAGAAAVNRHGRHVPPFPETLAYVPRVLSRLASLQRSEDAAWPATTPQVHRKPDLRSPP